MKIELNKKYETENGSTVRLAFIEGDAVYGHVKTDAHGWWPYTWHKETGVHYETDSVGIKGYNLVELLPKYSVKTELWISEDGELFMPQQRPGVEFIARIFIHTDIKKGETVKYGNHTR